ncbi:ClbS/DfsB family four-helix bundle protein [Amphibacillus sediminis]|uniref:ClbS/DfsB family four-helix bundle protein n=1 Tax=Amphibacillus sediminis TaxID=360185 RepID=UPI00082FF4FF|nr:ClbS/DfsB family four-helix bundle protein [Amphibacillus sediminis]
MPKPKNKNELLEEAKHQYQHLIDLIDVLSPADQDKAFLFEDRDKNIRDVLVHLHEWHIMLEGWYQLGVVEQKNPETPAKGFTWRQLPELNLKIWQKYQQTSLAEAKTRLNNSHHRMLELIEKHTDEELFTKKRYPWTKTTSLAAYFIANTSSHYLWAQKKIKKQLRLLKQLA